MFKAKTYVVRKEWYEKWNYVQLMSENNSKCNKCFLMPFSGNDHGPCTMSFNFGDIQGSGGTLTSNLPKSTGKDQRLWGLDYKATIAYQITTYTIIWSHNMLGNELSWGLCTSECFSSCASHILIKVSSLIPKESLRLQVTVKDDI